MKLFYKKLVSNNKSHVFQLHVTILLYLQFVVQRTSIKYLSSSLCRINYGRVQYNFFRPVYLLVGDGQSKIFRSRLEHFSIPQRWLSFFCRKNTINNPPERYLRRCTLGGKYTRGILFLYKSRNNMCRTKDSLNTNRKGILVDFCCRRCRVAVIFIFIHMYFNN